MTLVFVLNLPYFIIIIYLSVKPFTKGSQHIISGNVVNSDMTIPIGLFKKRLNNLLLATQNEGSSSEWGISNSLGL